MNESLLQLLLVGIVLIIVILLIVLMFMHFNEKAKKNREEEELNPKKDDTDKVDKKSVFRFMEFDEIQDNMIVQDGGNRYLMVVECKGVNYDLLSGVEKTSVEEGFIQFLNTLKHEIQIYIQTRKVNINQSVQNYKAQLRLIEQDLREEEARYAAMQNSGNATKDELLREIKEVTKKRNLYEYGSDIIENTEQMAENRDITTKQYYIVIPYYTDEISSSGDFDKREISSMAFSELYTRAQTIVSALTACEVRGRILNSQELIELLYVAYNREQYDIYDFETYMTKSGYQSLYSVSENVLDKRMRAIDEEIERKANQTVVNAFENATEEMKRKRAAIAEREARMQEYIDERAEQMVDSQSGVIGKTVSKMTKENIKDLSEKRKRRIEKEKEGLEKLNKEEEIDLSQSIEISDDESKGKKKKKKLKEMSDEEKRRKILAKRKKLMKEREENERKENSKK